MFMVQKTSSCPGGNTAHTDIRFGAFSIKIQAGSCAQIIGLTLTSCLSNMGTWGCLYPAVANVTK